MNIKQNKTLQESLFILGGAMTICGFWFGVRGFPNNDIGIISTLLWIIVMMFGVGLYNISHNNLYRLSAFYRKSYDNNIIFFNKHIFKIKVGVIILILLIMVPVIHWPHSINMGNRPTFYGNETAEYTSRLYMGYTTVFNFKMISLFLISTLWIGVKYLELWLRGERRKIYGL